MVEAVECSNCTPHPWHSYVRNLSTFFSCLDGQMAAHSHCSYHHKMLPPIRETWLKSKLMWVWKPYHRAIVEVVGPLHPTSISYIHKVFEHLQLLWMGILLHTHTVTTTRCHWLKSQAIQVWTAPCHYSMVETPVEPFKLHSTSLAYIYTVFKYLLLPSGWSYDCTLTPLPPQTFPQIWEHWIKSKLLHYGWGCRTFQTVPHIQVIHT